MLALRLSTIVAFAILLIPYVALCATTPQPAVSSPAHLHRLEARKGFGGGRGFGIKAGTGKTIGTYLKNADRASNTVNTLRTIVSDIRDGASALFGWIKSFGGGNQDPTIVPLNGTASNQTASNGTAVQRRQVANGTDTDDSTTDSDDDNTDPTEEDPSDVPECTIDAGGMLSAMQDTQTKAASLMGLSSDADFQSAVTSFNQTLQPVFDGVSILQSGNELGGGAQFIPSPDMGSQFASLIGDSKQALQAISAPSSDAQTQISAISAGLDNATNIATATCGN